MGAKIDADKIRHDLLKGRPIDAGATKSAMEREAQSPEAQVRDGLLNQGKKIWWLSWLHKTPPNRSFWNSLHFLKNKYRVEDRTVSNNPELSAARSQLTNIALLGGADIVLWVDPTVAPGEEDFLALVTACHKDPGIHSALYCQDPMQPHTLGGPVSVRFNFRSHDNHVIDTQRGAAPTPVKWAQLGCVAIHRKVFEAVDQYVPQISNWPGAPEEAIGPHYFMPDVEPLCDEYLSGDDAFCERARGCGFPVMVHGAARVLAFPGALPPAGKFQLDANGGVKAKIPVA